MLSVVFMFAHRCRVEWIGAKRLIRGLLTFSLRLAAFGVLILYFPSGVFAQKLSVGVVGGAGLTDGFSDITFPSFYENVPGFPPPPIGTRFWSHKKDFVAGGMIELHFNRHWSIEANGLFRQLNGKMAAVMEDGSLNSISPHPIVTWQFPVLAKYRFHGERVRPFIQAGPSFRTAGNLNTGDPSHHGATAGAGIEMNWAGVKIAPSLRYTRWASDRDRLHAAQTAPNQIELLVAFSRAAESKWRPLGKRASLGVAGGFMLNQPERRMPYSPSPFGNTSSSDQLRTWLAGPRVELHISERWSAAVEANHRAIRSRTTYSFDFTDYYGVRHQGTHSYTSGPPLWQIPVLIRHRFRGEVVQPFLEAGPSFRLPKWDLATTGVMAGAGIRVKWRGLSYEPGLRYSYWGAARNRIGEVEPNYIRRNQVEAVFAVMF